MTQPNNAESEDKPAEPVSVAERWADTSTIEVLSGPTGGPRSYPKTPLLDDESEESVPREQ